MKEGHTLVIPKKETDYIFDLSADELAGLMVFAQKVAKAIAKAIPCKRVAVLVLGMQVPHAHVHLIPITNESEIFEHSKLKFLAIEYEATAAKIRQELE
jgi:histidine triad (HIT) family protein